MKKRIYFFILFNLIFLLSFLSSSAIKGDGICNESFESWWDEPGKINALDDSQTNVIDDCLIPPRACCSFFSCGDLTTKDILYSCQENNRTGVQERPYSSLDGEVVTQCDCFDPSGISPSREICNIANNPNSCDSFGESIYHSANTSGAIEQCGNENEAFSCSAWDDVDFGVLDYIPDLSNIEKYPSLCAPDKHCRGSYRKSIYSKLYKNVLNTRKREAAVLESYMQCYDECGYISDFEEQNICVESCVDEKSKNILPIPPIEPAIEWVNYEKMCTPIGEVISGEGNKMTGFCSEKVASCSSLNRSLLDFPFIPPFPYSAPFVYINEDGGNRDMAVFHSYFQSAMGRREECYCPFEYIGTTIGVDPLVFRKNYCKEEGCVLDYNEYVQPEKVDFERKFNPDAGPLYTDKNGNEKPMGEMEEVGGKHRTIIVPGDSIECIANFVLDEKECLEKGEVPVAKIKLGDIGEERATCYPGRASYTALDSEGREYTVDGYKFSFSEEDDFEYWKTSEGRWFRTKDNKVYLDTRQWEAIPSVINLRFSGGWFCPKSFPTSNDHRGTNHSCEVKEIYIGGAVVKGEEQPDKEKYITEDIVVAKHVFVFLPTSYSIHKKYFQSIKLNYFAKFLCKTTLKNKRETCEKLLNMDVSLWDLLEISEADDSFKEGRFELSVEDHGNSNIQYSFFKGISEINNKIKDAGKPLFLNPKMVTREYPRANNFLSAFTFSQFLLMVDPLTIFYRQEHEYYEEANSALVRAIMVLLVERMHEWLRVNALMIADSIEVVSFIKERSFSYFTKNQDIIVLLVKPIPGREFQSVNNGFSSSVIYIDADKESYSVFSHEVGHAIGKLRDEYSLFDWKRQSIFLPNLNPFPECCLKKNGYSCVFESGDYEGSCKGMPYETDWTTKDEIAPGNEPIPYGPLYSIMGIDGENSIYPIEAPCPLINC